MSKRTTRAELRPDIAARLLREAARLRQQAELKEKAASTWKRLPGKSTHKQEMAVAV